MRVRLRDNKAFLNIKGKACGIIRSEYEYPIPPIEAEEMLKTLALDPPVEKIRYIVPAENGLFWDVDEYSGTNAPLFTAEIELPDTETSFSLPDWIGEDISCDSRYTNRALSRKPYSMWSDEEK